jgi:hypothetical protein
METITRDELTALSKLTYVDETQKKLILLSNRIVHGIRETVMTKPSYAWFLYVPTPDYVSTDALIQHLKLACKGCYVAAGPGEQMVKISW